MVARRAREEAELEGVDHIVFPAELLARQDDPDVARMIAGESKLFQTRRNSREGMKSQLNERVAQSQEEIGGLIAQVESKDKQIDWIIANLDGVSLSFDGLPRVHDAHRPTASGGGSSERVMHTLRRFDAAERIEAWASGELDFEFAL